MRMDKKASKTQRKPIKVDSIKNAMLYQKLSAGRGENLASVPAVPADTL